MKNAPTPYRLSASAACGLALLAALGVAGCVSEPPPPSTVVVGPTGRPVTDDAPLYCYRTLAGADCYAERLDGPPNRLIRGVVPIETGPRQIVE